MIVVLFCHFLMTKNVKPLFVIFNFLFWNNLRLKIKIVNINSRHFAINILAHLLYHILSFTMYTFTDTSICTYVWYIYMIFFLNLFRTAHIDNVPLPLKFSVCIS